MVLHDLGKRFITQLISYIADYNAMNILLKFQMFLIFNGYLAKFFNIFTLFL